MTWGSLICGNTHNYSKKGELDGCKFNRDSNEDLTGLNQLESAYHQHMDMDQNPGTIGIPTGTPTGIAGP